MSKPFGKRTKDRLKTQLAKEFLQLLGEGRNLPFNKLVKVVQGNYVKLMNGKIMLTAKTILCMMRGCIQAEIKM